MTIHQRSLWMDGYMHAWNLLFKHGIFVKSGFNKGSAENTTQNIGYFFTITSLMLQN